MRQMVGDNGEVDRTASDCERCLDWHRRPLSSRDCILSKQQQYSLITCEIKSAIKETISRVATDPSCLFSMTFQDLFWGVFQDFPGPYMLLYC